MTRQNVIATVPGKDDARAIRDDLPEAVISIGDEVRDIEAARAAGIACGAVRWGFASTEALQALGPDLIFERMEDIVRGLRPAT